MARRKLTEPTALPDWQDKTRAGTQVRIRGERGTYTVRYEAAADTPCGEHVCLWGGPNSQYRHVRPASVVWPRKRRGGA